MTLRDFSGFALRHAVGLPLVACAALVACSNSPPAAPEAFVNLTKGPPPDAAHRNWCSTGSSILVLGVGTDVNLNVPMTQATMTAQSTGNVAVDCSVTGAFDVSLTAKLVGTIGGTLEVRGHVDLIGGSHILANFSTNGDQFSQPDCTIAFTYRGGRVPATPPIALGRIWAHLSCPLAANSARQLKPNLPDPTPVDETCDLEADFEFINCSTS